MRKPQGVFYKKNTQPAFPSNNFVGSYNRYFIWIFVCLIIFFLIIILAGILVGLVWNWNTIIILKDTAEIIFTFHVAKEMIGCLEEDGPASANLEVSEYSKGRREAESK